MAKEQYFGMLFMLSWGGSHGFVESRFENSQQPRLCRPHKTNLTPKNWGGLSLKMNSVLGLALGNPCLTFACHGRDSAAMLLVLWQTQRHCAKESVFALVD
jgi:hypothetical protein